MFKIKFLLLCAFLTLKVESALVKSPRNLIDQVREELNQLQSIVQGAILAAHNDLSDLKTDFLTYGNNVMAEGSIAINQEQANIDAQLTAIKDLAHGANADISACTDIREELLGRLPAEHNDQLKSCVFDKNKQEASLISDATYIVDVTINQVHNLEFRIRQCREDLLCIAPLLTEIQLAKIRLPQNINTEVNTVETFLTTLRLSVQQCSDTSVSQYIADSFSILQDITECVNGILGSKILKVRL